MARRGKFGRSRRNGSPNLTALIAGLMREQRAAEDRAISDAYQNGGLYKGKPVTDSRYISYLEGRRDGFAKDDPLYDQWNNSVIQTKFSIGEQKIGLAFKQGKVGAGAVAAFYRHQLSKIPKDSAFYREVAGRAADWAKAAVGAARGRARGRAASGLKKKQEAVQKIFDRYGDINSRVIQAAQRAGIEIKATQDGRVDWTAIDATDFQALFARGIAGPSGKPITFAEWQKAAGDAYKGYTSLINIAKQAGRTHKTLDKDRAKFFNQTIVTQNVVDDHAKVEIATDQWADEIDAAKGDPNKVLTANQRFAAALGGILAVASAASGGNVNDPEFIGHLQNTYDAVSGGTPKGQTLDLNLTGSDGKPLNVSDIVAGAAADAKLLNSGKAYYGQKEPGGPMGVNAYPPNADSDPFGRHGLDPAHQPSITYIDGTATTAILVGEPVMAAGLETPDGAPATDLPDGKGGYIPVEQASPQQLANALAAGYQVASKSEQILGYTFDQGGEKTYGVYAPDGTLVFTATNPFSNTYPIEGVGANTLIVGGATNGAGKIVPNLTTNTIGALVAPSSLLVDPTVNPNDIRALASTAPDEVTAKAYLDAADALANRNYSHDSYYDSHVTTSAVEGISHMLDQGAAGPLGQMLNQGLGALGDVLRKVTLPTPPPTSSFNFRPPDAASPPVLPGKAADDLAAPKPPVVSATSSGIVPNTDTSFYHPPTGKASSLTKPKPYQPYVPPAPGGGGAGYHPT